MRYLVVSLLLASCTGGPGETTNTSSSSSSSSSSSGSPSSTIVSAPFAPDGGVCPEGWFLRDAERRCYKECETDADCGYGYSHCRTLGLSLGGDYSCNGKQRICDLPGTKDECE